MRRATDLIGSIKRRQTVRCYVRGRKNHGKTRGRGNLIKRASSYSS